MGFSRGHQTSRLEGPGTSLPGYFMSFPYLVTHIVRSFYHLMVLPAEFIQTELADVARRQVQANRLESCLVLDEENCVYFSIRGVERKSAIVPESSLLCTGRLRPCRDFADSEDFRNRLRRLEAFISERRRNGILYGDLSKGGQEASFEELARLSGTGPTGAPAGLDACHICGEMKGRCLDPSPEFRGRIMTVTCRCENDNRCARCGRPLADHKLNSNYYDPADGLIWHVPAFCCLNHKCPGLESTVETAGS